MNPISEEDVMVVKDTPKYATRIPSRSPEIKYQQRGTAKNAMHYHFREHRGPKQVIYKYDQDLGVYTSIFDSHSELADAVRDGKLTLKKALEGLDW